MNAARTKGFLESGAKLAVAIVQKVSDSSQGTVDIVVARRAIWTIRSSIIALCVRRYFRYALSLRNLEEIMAERNVSVDHVTIWRWIQRYAPELSQRCRPRLRMTNGSWRVDETYLRIAGKWTYLYRAVDSTGDTIDFLLSRKRDADAAKRFFQNVLRSPNHPRPRVINVDKNPCYPKVVEELKRTRELGRRCRCRPVRYLNNVVEQDHRAIKRRVRASQGFRSFHSAWKTIQGIETINMIRKGGPLVSSLLVILAKP